MITYGRAISDKDLEQILALQQKNLFNAVSSEEKKKEGFVTVSHSYGILKEMNESCSHIIAKSAGRVVGYALCMHPKFADRIKVLKPMFTEIQSLQPKIKKYIVMGQICIDKAHRKKGVFRQLYAAMRQAVRPEFDTIITEVDAENTRSLQAHYAVGFQDLKTYTSGGQQWKLIALN